MAKKVLTLIKLQIPGGQANPAPPVGPHLQVRDTAEVYAENDFFEFTLIVGHKVCQGRVLKYKSVTC